MNSTPNLSKLDQFVAWTDEEVVEEIGKRLNVFKSSLIELAEIVGPAYRRGIDLTQFGLPALVIDSLRKIESGQIAPELAERFMHTRAFNFVKSLPLDDQKQIAETGTVSIVERIDNGKEKFDYRKVPVDALTVNQLRQVFNRGRICSRVEQQQHLEDLASIPPDEFEEVPTVCLRIKADIDVTKAQLREFNELKEKAGSMSALVKQAILKLL